MGGWATWSRAWPSGPGRGHRARDPAPLRNRTGSDRPCPRVRRRGTITSDPQGETFPMPHVATSPADLLGHLAGIAHVDGDRLVIDDEAALRAARIRDLAWTATFSDGRGHIEAARWIVWEASQALGARSASIQDLYMARARGEFNGFTVPAINLRAQTFDMARVDLRDRRGRTTSGAVILELARSEQTYTFQRPTEYPTSVLAGAIAAGWHGPGLHPGRPLPVQREEVRGRSRGHDRGAPPRLPPGGRRRLPQHRHRQLHAGRPVEAHRRRAAARELRAGGRADRAHPRRSSRRRDRQRRRRDRRGRQAELDRRGAARRTSTATARARAKRPRRRGASPR